MATKGKQDDSADKQKASTTAILVSAIRAAHLIWNDPPLFSDTYALQMVTPFWRQVAKRRPLKWLIADVLLGVLKPITPRRSCASASPRSGSAKRSPTGSAST